MIDVFREVIADQRKYGRSWKDKTGKKVIGYLCTYMPEELVYAAGLLPVRVVASEEPPVLAERYMAQWTCPFSRGCLEQGLRGRYDYLDALVFPWTCSHTHAASYYWGAHVPNAVTYLLSLPKAMERRGAKSFLIAELTAFKDWLEKLCGIEIEGKDIERGIEICNNNRRLMRQVYNLRKQNPPLISGHDAIEMVLAGQLMDKTEHSLLLSHWLQDEDKRSNNAGSAVRLMVVGSCVDKPQVMQLIEGMGASVVIDDLCTGTRYFWDEVSPGDDPLAAIAQRLIDKVNCPAKIAGDRRYNHILKLAVDYNVQGVIILHQKFCNPHGNDYPNLRNRLNENGYPSLLLELDIPVPGGQIKNRVQTFVEMLETER